MPLVLDIQTITAAIWPSFQDATGKILDEYSIRKWAFYKGVNEDIRAELWRFLLNYYHFTSTREDRKRIDTEKKLKYEEICTEVECCSNPEKAAALAKYQKVIEKDCLRTDCHLAYYQGEEGRQNVNTLQRILSCFVAYNPEMGYVQGMNELLSPLLLVLGSEHEAFWCLTSVLNRMKSVFNDLTLSQPLRSLARLCCYADKQLHDHIDSVYESEDWVFCYRNVLLVFKREFSTEEVRSLWETIWCDHMTRYFEIFISVAVLIHNREQILQCTTVESFMEFSMKLSGTIPLQSVMSIARSLLEQLKNDEYCPYELRYLVSSDGCAPPPLVGFVRARQRFATLHTNKINTQRLEIQRSMFGELFIEPASSSQRLSLASPQSKPAPLQHPQTPDQSDIDKQHATTQLSHSATDHDVVSSPPPKAGFIPRAQTNGISFREDIRKVSVTSPPPFSPGPSPHVQQTHSLIQPTTHPDSFKSPEHSSHDYHRGAVITQNQTGTFHQHYDWNQTYHQQNGNGTVQQWYGNGIHHQQNGNRTHHHDQIGNGTFHTGIVNNKQCQSNTTTNERSEIELPEPQSRETLLYPLVSENKTVQCHTEVRNTVENGSYHRSHIPVQAGGRGGVANGHRSTEWCCFDSGTRELENESDFDQLRSDAELSLP